MAPIKQEELMKDKLEERSLQPSPGSWAMLSNRLEAKEKKNKTSLFWRIGVAASIVGILFVTSIYFNNQVIEKNIPIVVDKKENVIPKKETQFGIVPSQSNEVVVEEIKSVENSSKKAISNSNFKTITSEKNTIKEELPPQTSVAEVEKYETPETSAGMTSETGSKNETLAEIKKSKLNFENQKILDVVAEINQLKENGNAVTETEIENLLQKAQKEILSNRIYNEQTRTVDANALLQDVEADLQLSFRSKVFEALQFGYESVLTAVTERNN